MNEPSHIYHSFIIRCWREADGHLRGRVVDVSTQRSYPFDSGGEIAAHIESLAQTPGLENPEANDSKPAEDN